MKKAYVLIFVIFLILALSFLMQFDFVASSYNLKSLRDNYRYLQAKILINDSKTMAQYFLYKAKKENKQCLDSISFNYPNKNDLIKIEYFYPIAKCENFILSDFNKDVNLSANVIILAHISVALDTDKNVDEEIFLTKNVILRVKEGFWTKP